MQGLFTMVSKGPLEARRGVDLPGGAGFPKNSK